MAQFSLNFGWVLGSYQNISTKVESVKENKYLTAPKDHSMKCGKSWRSVALFQPES